MSASREKKIRQDLAAQGVTDPKKIREAEEKAKARKNNILYGVIAGVFVIVAAVLLVYNSGVLQRSATAGVFLRQREEQSGEEQLCQLLRHRYVQIPGPAGGERHHEDRAGYRGRG